MDRREKAIAELKRQIQEQKARIDPALLRRAEEALRASREDGLVPYDRAAALQAIEMFIKDHADGKDFEARLLQRLKKEQH